MLREDRYSKYFRVDGDRLLIHSDIFKHRKDFKEDTRTNTGYSFGSWKGGATKAERDEFNYGITEYGRMRNRYNKHARPICLRGWQARRSQVRDVRGDRAA